MLLDGVIYKLMKERRIVFIVLLLIILLYVDYGIAWKMQDPNVLPYPYFANSYTFAVFALLLILQDLLAYGRWFPRMLFKAQIIACLFVLIWHIYDNTFRESNCNTVMPQIGLLGERISICSIRRIIYQSFLSLILSPTVALLYEGRIDNLYFIKANLYRSTGTIQRGDIRDSYMKDILVEKHASKKIPSGSRNLKKMQQPEKETEDSKISLTAMNRINDDRNVVLNPLNESV